MAKIVSDDLWPEEKQDTGKQRIVRKVKRKCSLSYQKIYVTLSDK